MLLTDVNLFKPCVCHTGVASLSTEGDKGVLVELPCLVIGCFEDSCAAHSSFGRRDDGEVLARDSKKYLPTKQSARFQSKTTYFIHFDVRVEAV